MMHQETKTFTKVEGLEIIHMFMEKHSLEKLSLSNIDSLFSSLDFIHKLLTNLGWKEMKKHDLELSLYSISLYEKEKLL